MLGGYKGERNGMSGRVEKISRTSRRLKGVASLIATAKHEKLFAEIEWCSQNIMRLISSRPKTNSVNESVKLEMPSLTCIRSRRPGRPGRPAAGE